MTMDRSPHYAWQAFRAMSLLASSREQLGATDATEKHAAASRLAESLLADGLFDLSHVAYLRQSAVEHALRAGDVARWRSLAERYSVRTEPCTSTVDANGDASAKALLERAVTKLIIEAERKERDDPPRAAALYRDLSRYEELLADVSDREPDLSIAQGGAIRAARLAGAFAREHALALRYAPLIPVTSTVVRAPEQSPRRRAELRALLVVLLASTAAWPCLMSMFAPSFLQIAAGGAIALMAVSLVIVLALLSEKDP